MKNPFVTWSSYSLAPREVIPEYSQTVQDADLTIREVVQRYTRKLPYPVDPRAFYEEDERFAPMLSMDQFERRDYMVTLMASMQGDGVHVTDHDSSVSDSGESLRSSSDA